MKFIKLSVLALVVTVFSFITSPIDAKTTTTATQFTLNQDSNNEAIKYVVIDGDLYVVHYDDDGRIMLIEPAE